MDAVLLLGKVVRGIREGGVLGALRKGWALARSGKPDAFDQVHGTDTSGMVPLWACSVSSPNKKHGVRYQATSEEDISANLEFLQTDLSDFTYIDLGCGKGRTLLVAARHGFRKLIGVEFVEKLAEIARSNLRKLGISNSEIVCRDVVDFVFPDGNLVVFLYNPFDEPVLRRVVERLGGTRGRVYVIYQVPRCRELLDASGFLRYIGGPHSHSAVWTNC